MRSRGTSLLWAGVLLLALSTAGCGQRGPLYHPDAKPQPAPAPASTPAPAGAAGAADAAAASPR